MLGSKIYVEGRTYKEEGTIQYAGYEVFIVKILNPLFKAGETLQCMVTYERSMDSFVSTVLKIEQDKIYILTPPILRDKWMIPREHTRFPFQLNGKINAVSFTGQKPLIELIQPLIIEIHDISEGGIGFSSTTYLREKGIAQVSFTLDGQAVYLDVEIVNYIFSKEDQRYYFGGKFKEEISSYHYEQIRVYIIKEQLKQLESEADKEQKDESYNQALRDKSLYHRI